MQILNLAGLNSFISFFLAAFSPDLSAKYLFRTLEATLSTVAFSLLGTILAAVLGFFGGIALSTIWKNSFQQETLTKFASYHLFNWLLRFLAAFPRGVHESIWAIFFIIIFGSNPIVGVLALGVPFGAITAKVFADMLDSADQAPFKSMLAAGSTRFQAFVFGTLPQTKNAFIAYAFYRFDCALRSAVILGMIGAGGIGFELLTAFQGLNYSRMWTQIYTLIMLGILAEQLSKKLRKSASWQLPALWLSMGFAGFSLWHLKISVIDIFAPRTFENLKNLLERAFPPALPSTWGQLLFDSLQTLGISIGAIILGASLGLGGATLSVYQPLPGTAAPRVLARKIVAFLSRIFLILLRSLSPPVWALLLLFVIFPGPLPGALALGLYNAGVMGRLLAETLEEMNSAPSVALQALGANSWQKFCFGTFPGIWQRFSDLSLYRWEVAIRESIVVGIVGAGGLGRVLETERAAFDYPALLTVVLTLIVLSFLVDVLSAKFRKELAVSRQL